MSSRYSILCMSHSPAIVIEPDYDTPGDAADVIMAGLSAHPGCDLMIGRYSYPLVALGCLDSISRQQSGRCAHRGMQWLDSQWLRLLLAAHQAPAGSAVQREAAAVRQCWTLERLEAIRTELGMGPEGGDGT